MSIENRTGREQFRNISLQILHPRFEGGASAFDVALIRLSAPLEFNDFVQPIALPEFSPRPEQTGTVTAFGWGSTAERLPHTLPDELQVSFS